MPITLDDVWAELRAIRAMLEHASTEKPASRVATTNGAAVADDSDLDGEWGDPIVKKDPSRWKGDSYAGSRMSQCPSDYLRAVASLVDWQADQDEKTNHVYTNKEGKQVPTAPFKRRDAARARGWAKRNEGRAVQAQPFDATTGEVGDGDIPF
jgi:hypothetical protein